MQKGESSQYFLSSCGALFYSAGMFWRGVFFIVLASVLPVAAEDWTTADGKTYRNVVVTGQEDDGVRITYTGGVGKIPYYELSLELQKRFGEDYDSLEVKRLAAEKALAEATRRAQQAAEQKKQQDEAAAQLQRSQPGQNGAQPQYQPQPGGPIQPGIASQPGNPNQPGVVNQPGNPNQAGNASPLAEQQTHSGTSAPTVQVEEKVLYPGSIFSYNDSIDYCYLDSPTVNVLPVLLEAAPNAPVQVGTIFLRIATEGHKAETPDRIDVTFRPPSTAKQVTGIPKIKFLVDGANIPVPPTEKPEGEAPAAPGADRILFSLSPEQARAIFHGKKVNFSVGSNDYRIDEAGLSTLQKYFADVDRLPPASTNLVKTCHRFINKLPSIVSMISTACEYVILGSFGLLTIVCVSAFFLGMSRIIKW
jgi:hypothetical protein